MSSHDIHPKFREYWEQAGYIIRARQHNDEDNEGFPTMYYAGKNDGREQLIAATSTKMPALYSFSFNDDKSLISEGEMLRYLSLKSFL